MGWFLSLVFYASCTYLQSYRYHFDEFAMLHELDYRPCMMPRSLQQMAKFLIRIC